MKWLRGSWVTWVLAGAGLLTTGCAGVVGASAAVVVVGAGVLSMTCYDRVSVTVTDKLTGTPLCDARVTFTENGSETVANSCYQAALSTGRYKLRVERRGLVPYEVPIEINTGKSCKHAVQTLYVALDRPNLQQPPQQIAPPPAPATASPPAPATASPPAAPAPSAPPAAAPPPATPATPEPPAPPPSAPTTAPAPPATAPPAPPPAPTPPPAPAPTSTAPGSSGSF